MARKNKIFIVDSTVIIDYLNLGNDVLSKVNKYIGNLFVL